MTKLKHDIADLKIPPHNLESEQAIIAGIFINSTLIKTLKISVDDFYRISHSQIYKTMVEMDADGIVIEPSTLANELDKRGLLETSGGMEYLMSLLDNNSTSVTVPYHEGVVRELSLKRSILNFSHELGNMTTNGTETDDIVGYVKEFISNIGSLNTGGSMLSKEIREWVLSTSGHFLSTDIYREFGFNDRTKKKHVSTILLRMCEDAIIEKHGDKRGCFRLIDRTLVEQEWWKGNEGVELPIRFPLEIDEFIRIYPGNVILLEGQKSQGKSAFAIEFCRLNRSLFNERILYQNLEMSTGELEERFRSYGDVMSIEEWRKAVLFAKLDISGCWDKVFPNGLNIIDYLVEYREPWKLPQYVLEVHKKLENGVALVIVQRDPFKPYPTGGRGVRDIPRAVISLMKHKVRLEDVKSFKQTPYGNPTGLCMKYKQASWWKFISASGWDHEEDEKYEAFKKG